MDFLLILFLSAGLLCADFTSGQKCNDTDTTACSLLHRSNPNLCSDLSVAQSICPKFCGLCPLTCYNCQTPTQDPINCNNTAVCRSNENCMLKELRPSSGHNEYIMMCVEHKVCDGFGLGFSLIGKRDIGVSLHSRDVSITCCNKDLCNMPVLSTVSPSTIKSTGVPLLVTTDHHGVINATVSSGPRHCPRDILFIVDSSDSMGLDNFQLIKNFIASVISDLNIGVYESHVAVLTFSSTLHLEWNLNTYDNKQDLINAVPRIRYIGQGTNTSDALHYARTMFTSFIGDRKGFPNVVIVVTDGRSMNPVQTAIEAAALQHVAKVIAIGIGPEVDNKELQAIATDPDQQNVYLVRNFNELQNILIHIGSVVC